MVRIFSKKMSVALAVFAIFMVCGRETAEAQDGPVVHVAQGELRGREMTSVLGKTIYSFQGIPYAKPPVGDLRFKDAEEPVAWSGARDASSEGCQCVQMNHAGAEVEGCEDCLFLNVYTPQLPQSGSEPLPVMFYIHGGGFVSGSGNADVFGPDYLVAEDVVLVTINYRLSALGFLFLKKAAPGNAGLKDQVAALRWVKKNIAAFNGDPKKVTIFGGSAGGVSVHWHMLSPMSKGLFHGAIAQSGTAVSPWAVQNEPYATSRRLAERVGCSQGDDRRIVECLRKADYKDIVKASGQAMSDADKSRLVAFPFVVALEEETAWGVEKFVPGPPKQVIEHGCQHDVPFMTGITADEWMLLIALHRTLFDTDDDLKALDSNWTQTVRYETRLPDDSKDVPKAMEDLREFFLDGKPLTFDNLQGYKDMFSDLESGDGMYYTVKYMAKSKKNALYVYSFTVSQDLNYLKKQMDSQLPGAGHDDDTGYLFKIDILPDVSPDNPAYTSRQRMVRLWTNFAKFGNPTPHEDPLIEEQWKPYTTEERNYFEIGSELKAGQDLNKERVEFWEDFYKKFGGKREKGCWFTCSSISFWSFFAWLFSWL